MTGFVLERADARVLLWHLAVYGLAAILEDGGVDGISVTWTVDMQPRPVISGDGLSASDVDELVRRHAEAHATGDTWVLADVELHGSQRALMSPRLTPFADSAVWQRIQHGRHEQLDRLTARQAWLDLRMLAALGEPCYWSENKQRIRLQDDGASRFEMQPRNQGSEFVGSRLRKVAQAVAARADDTVAAGLAGASSVDEIGDDRVDSRTATGLAAPGPTDNAVVWCALWGMSQFPLAYRINGAGRSAGHVGRARQEWFYVPIWHSSWCPAKIRSILAEGRLRESATVGLPAPWALDDARVAAARQWAQARGVAGIMRFRIERFGSDSAPERRAMLGVRVPITLR